MLRDSHKSRLIRFTSYSDDRCFCILVYAVHILKHQSFLGALILVYAVSVDL